MSGTYVILWRDGRVAEGDGLLNRYTGNRIGGSNPPLSATSRRSVPDTWVTVYTGDIGNTLAPKGLLMGSNRELIVSKNPRS